MCFQPLVSCVKMVFGKLLKTTRSQVGWLSNATKFRERCSVFGTRRTARVKNVLDYEMLVYRVSYY